MPSAVRVVPHPDRGRGADARGRGTTRHGRTTIFTGRPGAQREQAHVHLEADVLARPERAADARELEAHSLLGQTEALRDLTAVLVQPLRGDEQLDAAPVAVGQRERGLEAEEGLVLHADLVGALDHDVADDALVTALDALMAEARCRRDGSAAASIARSGSVSGSSTSYSTTIASHARRAVSGWSAATAAIASPDVAARCRTRTRAGPR